MPIHKRVSYVVAAFIALMLISREAPAFDNGSVVEREIHADAARRCPVNLGHGDTEHDLLFAAHPQSILPSCKILTRYNWSPIWLFERDRLVFGSSLCYSW